MESADAACVYSAAMQAVQASDWICQLAFDKSEQPTSVVEAIVDLNRNLIALRTAKANGAFRWAEQVNAAPATACGRCEPTWLAITYEVTKRICLLAPDSRSYSWSAWRECAERIVAYTDIVTPQPHGWPSVPRDRLRAELRLELARLTPLFDKKSMAKKLATGRKEKRSRPSALDTRNRKANAIVLASSRPDLTNQQIADQVKLDRKTLERSSLFQRARSEGRATGRSVRRGTKVEGNVEAFDEWGDGD